MVVWNSLAFLMIQQTLAIWPLVPLLFLNSAWTSGSSWFTHCWSLAWRIFEHYFASVWDECNCVVVWTLALPFFGIGMKTDLFQSCGHSWDFQICSAVAKFFFFFLVAKFWKLKLSQIWTSLWYSSCVILTCLLQSSGTTLVSLYHVPVSTNNYNFKLSHNTQVYALRFM